MKQSKKKHASKKEFVESISWQFQKHPEDLREPKKKENP